MDYLGFQALFNMQQNAMLLVDKNDNVILANQAAHVLLGYNDAQLNGLPIQAIIPKLDTKYLSQQYQDIGGHPLSQSFRRYLWRFKRGQLWA